MGEIQAREQAVAGYFSSCLQLEQDCLHSLCQRAQRAGVSPYVHLQDFQVYSLFGFLLPPQKSCLFKFCCVNSRHGSEKYHSRSRAQAKQHGFPRSFEHPRWEPSLRCFWGLLQGGGRQKGCGYASHGLKRFGCFHGKFCLG